MKGGRSEHTGELVALVREGRMTAVVARASHLRPVDLADVLVELAPAERRGLITLLPSNLAARALLDMPRDTRPERTLADLGFERAAMLVAGLADDDAASLLGRLTQAERAGILERLPDSAALNERLAYASTSAGGLMTSRVVAVSELDPIALAVEGVRRQAVSVGTLTEVFVVDAERRLCGVLSVSQLLLAAPTQLVRDVMAHGVVHVGPDEDRQLVAGVIGRYNLGAVPVVDGTGRLLGRVTADNVRDAAIDEATDDLLRFGGVSVAEGRDARWTAGVRNRLPWLYTNLLPAFGAAAVVYFFKGAVARIVTLAVWMPVVAGVGGNAGTQALAASVRRLMLNPNRRPRLRRLVVREAVTGILNGAGIGAVVGGMAVLLGESWKFGLVVAVAMGLNLALSAIAGAALPIILRRLGRDPALASSVVVTAITDATGFALLLGLAKLVLL